MIQPPFTNACVNLFFLGAVLFSCVGAVDRAKFRTCEQGSFCRRYRQYVKEIEASGGTKFAHSIESGSIKADGHQVIAKIAHVNDVSVKPLALDLRFFRDSAEGNCGIVRLFVTEVDPLHARFRLREGDVVVKEEEFLTDAVTVEEAEGGKAVRISSSAPGKCAVVLRHSPFELDFLVNDHIVQKLNSRHLMNFESYREKDAPLHQGLVDATFLDKTDLFEEGFAGHSDTKPRGPAGVAMDVTFPDAVDVFGLAQHATNFGLGASKMPEPYRFFNLDVFEYDIDVPMALYGAIPVVTAIHQWSDGSPATASGFFFVNPSEGFVQVDPPGGGSGMFSGGSDKGQTTWWAFESGVMDIFLFAGPTTDSVLAQYHTVTGMPRLPPLATLGKHQSRWNYVDVKDSVNVNKKFDQNDIPYDVLWLDIEHTDGKKYFTWHPTHFKDPEVLLDTLEKSKRKLVTIVDPHIKREEGYDVFTSLRDKDLYTKTKTGDQYDGWCWPGTSYYPDFCNPQMRNEWAKFFSLDYYPHNRKDLWTWNDMNEPSVFNGPEVTMPRDNLHKCHTDAYTVEHRDVHNVYGYYHHGATVQGQLERAPDTRPFVLTRSFFAGSHRHGAMWTGDNMARWNHLEKSVPMLLSLCMCGMSFAGADVPGFFFDPEPELFTRWHQLGIWYPFYRGHAHLETKRREPWMLGDEITNMVRDQVTVRYQMLPYLYTLFAEWAHAGRPIMRPLWYHNLDDKEAFSHQDDAFLLGEAILVRAISKAGMKDADVYFPRGNEWYDFYDAKATPVVSGQVLSVPLRDDRVPTYVRSGHILFKKMRRRRSTGAMEADPYTIVVYGSKAKSSLYVDDGISHEYKKGAFAYEEFVFDGVKLSESSGHGLWGSGKPLTKLETHGLQQTPAWHNHVERVVFVGLPKQPVGAKLTPAPDGGDNSFSVFSEKSTDGKYWIATVKKPACKIGNKWSLELLF